MQTCGAKRFVPQLWWDGVGCTNHPWVQWMNHNISLIVDNLVRIILIIENNVELFWIAKWWQRKRKVHVTNKLPFIRKQPHFLDTSEIMEMTSRSIHPKLIQPILDNNFNITKNQKLKILKYFFSTANK